MIKYVVYSLTFVCSIKKFKMNKSECLAVVIHKFIGKNGFVKINVIASTLCKYVFINIKWTRKIHHILFNQVVVIGFRN